MNNLFISIFALSIAFFAIYSIYSLTKNQKKQIKFHRESNMKRALKYIHEHKQGSSTLVLIELFGCETVSGLIYGGLIKVDGLNEFRAHCEKEKLLNELQRSKF